MIDYFKSKLSPEDTNLQDQIINLMNHREYQNAFKLILKRLTSNLDVSKSYDAIIKSKLAGFLVDIGSEAGNDEILKKGLDIFLKDYDSFRMFFSKASLQYNIGNAKSSLYKINSNKDNLNFRANNIELLTEAKNHFWQAYITLSPSERVDFPDLLTNLANALDSNGRVVEALQYYDIVLKTSPDFPMANANRSNALLWLIRITNVYSANLLKQVIQGFDKAINSEMPEWQKDNWRLGRDKTIAILKSIGKDYDPEHDISETQKEFESLSPYRRFCIENHLTLSEHSLYCKCIGTRRDDLSIPTPVRPIGGIYIPRMELILNRIKAEYAFARLLFFRSVDDSETKWDSYDDELVFSELSEGEVIGVNNEMLRTSFRLCFGILDKIALAICDLFKLAKEGDKIYFDNFFSDCKRKQKINDIPNPSLVALFSQTTDLNQLNGEWSFFKKWRNKLEHGLLIIQNSSDIHNDKYKVFEGQFKFFVTSEQEFKQNSLELLRFVRSAIFNFVFCVRHEGVKEIKNNNILFDVITFKNKNKE
jgi:tetratricopeptide (TPR) repeat protein